MTTQRNRRRYCYRTPLFPKSAFVAYLSLTTQQTDVGLYPMPTLYTDINDARDDVMEYNGSMQFGNTTLTLSQNGFLVPVHLKKRTPLKRKFWLSPSGLFTHEHRAAAFSSLLSQWPLYTVLVTPSRHGKTFEEHSAAAAFRKTVTDREIEQFMLASDFPVDESAKFAAIYDPDRPLVINWISGEVVPPRPPENASAVH